VPLGRTCAATVPAVRCSPSNERGAAGMSDKLKGIPKWIVDISQVVSCVVGLVVLVLTYWKFIRDAFLAAAPGLDFLLATVKVPWLAGTLAAIFLARSCYLLGQHRAKAKREIPATAPPSSASAPAPSPAAPPPTPPKNALSDDAVAVLKCVAKGSPGGTLETFVQRITGLNEMKIRAAAVELRKLGLAYTDRGRFVLFGKGLLHVRDAGYLGDE
jgi:hypothetical protein